MCVMKSVRRGRIICVITRCDLDCLITPNVYRTGYLRTQSLGLLLENGMDNEIGLWTVNWC